MSTRRFTVHIDVEVSVSLDASFGKDEAVSTALAASSHNLNCPEMSSVLVVHGYDAEAEVCRQTLVHIEEVGNARIEG